MRKLSTTSFAVLGLLALRDWSTYELNQQVRHSVGRWWPRTERQLYEQPKLLADHGLATASNEATGRRPRTVYSITPAGRVALRDWLGERPAVHVIQWELILKIFFAEQGTKEQLARNLHWTAEQYRAEAETAIAEAELLFAPDYPFAERHQLFALIAKLEFDVWATITDWLAWAGDQVDSWDDINGPSDATTLLRSIIDDAARP